MGIPTLITTNTITSGVAASAFTSSIDSTYDEYMFVFTDIHPETEGVFQVKFSTDGGSSYGLTKTTTFFLAHQREDGADAVLEYRTDSDLAQATTAQRIGYNVNNNNDSSMSGILHLFSPSSTTYVKHFYSDAQMAGGLGGGTNYSIRSFAAGYINTTTAVNTVAFEMSADNIDSGVIQMYGIA